MQKIHSPVYRLDCNKSLPPMYMSHNIFPWKYSYYKQITTKQQYKIEFLRAKTKEFVHKPSTCQLNIKTSSVRKFEASCIIPPKNWKRFDNWFLEIAQKQKPHSIQNHGKAWIIAFDIPNLFLIKGKKSFWYLGPHVYEFYFKLLGLFDVWTPTKFIPCDILYGSLPSS